MKKYSYRNFGHIPSYSLKRNFISFLFGEPNLYKRLQAKRIMNSIHVNQDEKILDFGCGSGYLTVELHRAGAKAFGLDVHKVPTHTALKECYDIEISIVKTGEKSPYPDNFFDKILVSEVLATIADSKSFLIELKRILKPNGTLIIVNAFGHPAIQSLYEKKGILFNFLKKIFPNNFPKDYSTYKSLLNILFSNSQKDFLSIESIKENLEILQFDAFEIKPSLKKKVADIISITQFFYYLKNNNPIFSQRIFYFMYLFLKTIHLFSIKECDNHLILLAKNLK